MSEKGLDIMSKRGLLGNHKVKPLQFYEHCVYRKQHWMNFPKVVHTTKAMLDYIHFDCWGSSRFSSLGGEMYFLSIIDGYFGMTWLFIMKQKSKAFKIFKHWMILMKNRIGNIVKCLRSGNGLEFCSTKFNEFYKDKDITRQHIVRYTPKQNGVVERMNKTLLEMVK